MNKKISLLILVCSLLGCNHAERNSRSGFNTPAYATPGGSYYYDNGTSGSRRYYYQPDRGRNYNSSNRPEAIGRTLGSGHSISGHSVIRDYHHEHGHNWQREHEKREHQRAKKDHRWREGNRDNDRHDREKRDNDRNKWQKQHESVNRGSAAQSNR